MHLLWWLISLRFTSIQVNVCVSYFVLPEHTSSFAVFRSKRICSKQQQMHCARKPSHRINRIYRPNQLLNRCIMRNPLRLPLFYHCDEIPSMLRRLCAFCRCIGNVCTSVFIQSRSIACIQGNYYMLHSVKILYVCMLLYAHCDNARPYKL